MKKILFISLFLTIFALNPALAQEEPVSEQANKEGESKQEIVLSENITEFLEKPSLVPGSPFYSLKIAWEKLGDAFSFGKNQAERSLKLAQERLEESNVLLEKGKIEEAGNLMAEYRKRLEEGGELVESLKEKTNSEDLVNNLQNLTGQHNTYFKELLTKLPESEIPSFEPASLESIKWQEVAIRIKDEVINKIKEVGENIKNVKELKNEIESELEEKLIN